MASLIFGTFSTSPWPCGLSAQRSSLHGGGSGGGEGWGSGFGNWIYVQPRGGVDVSLSQQKEATEKETRDHPRRLRGSAGIRGGSPDACGGRSRYDVLNNLGLGSGSGDSAGGGTVSPQQTEPTYTPPLHGTNSHGQGTDAVVDIAPSADLPYAADPVTNGEE